jgi:hypothetical protein
MNGEARRKPRSAAKRMRAYRERRRDGSRCVRVVINTVTIDQLVQVEIAVDSFFHFELQAQTAE